MTETAPPKKSLVRRITQILATVITIAFPFLVITLLPVGRLVTKLDALLDRTGPFGMVVFVVLLRISPILPYTLSRYIYGLAAVDFWHYIIASAVGMVPMVAVYVSIGAAGREAALAAAGRGHHQSTVEWIVLGVGLVVTIVAAFIIARAAKRELVAMRMERAGTSPAPE